MTKLEMLFIRACKQCDGGIRVYSVYRRFYLRTDRSITPLLNGILSNIIDKYCPLTITKLSQDIQNKLAFNMLDNGESPKTVEILFSVLLNHIAFTSANDFEGLIKPIRFKK